MEQLNFYYVLHALPTLLQGFVVTLQITFYSVLIGVVCGFIVALVAVSKSKILRVFATAFVEFFRCTPALVQLMWFFFALPLIIGTFPGPIITAVLALGLNLTAFNSEAYRAAIQAVPKAHLDASAALGLSWWTRTIHVVLPQVFRVSLPVLLTNGISMFQQSSLVALVAVGDLMFKGKMLASETYRPIETYTTVAIIYLALSLPLEQFVEYLERRKSRQIGS